jgi:hypothetical protein
MVRAIRETVTVEAGGVVRLCSQELSPGSRVEVIVIPEMCVPHGAALTSFKGSAKGVYDSPKHADMFIRSERDQWAR